MPNLAHFNNKENNSPPSGAAYVPAFVKGDPPGKTVKVLISKPQLCGHVNRVCVNCISEWRDHTFFFDRTFGGRRLKAELDKASH